MRLKLEIPESWPRTGEGVYAPEPEVRLTLGPLQPLPRDLRAWGDDVVMTGVDLSMYRVRNVDDMHTVRGWPVSVFFSDIMSILPDESDYAEQGAYEPQIFGGGGPGEPPGAPRVVERRLHALYLFDDYCAAASAVSKNLEQFDAVMSELRRVFMTGEPDWSGGRVDSIESLFRGLQTFRPPPPPPKP